MNMNFGANKTPVEVIKEGAFGGIIYEIFILVLMVNGIKSHGKNIDQNCYCLYYYGVSVNKYGVKCGVSLILGK